jgi:hydroxyacid-oxoacid transhydrogenase
VPLIPHGVAVSLTAPAVFNFTSPTSPDRHRTALEIFMGKDRAAEAAAVKDADLGLALRQEIFKFLDSVAVPRGLSKVGYGTQDIETLAKGMLPQRRVLDLAPGLAGKENQAEELEQLSTILEGSMSW